MKVKTKPITNFPDVETIKDASVKRFLTGLIDILIERFRDNYDDIRALVNVERTTSLNPGTIPAANLNSRGKFYLLEGTGGGADGLYICVNTGNNGYAFKEITLT
jgi:hypothetical protein